jgi:hypothetical protein
MKDIRTMTQTLALAVFLAGPTTTLAGDSWQERMLYHPTPAQLEVEQSRDRVMFYHGLTDTQVAQAMDQQFERIEHMMFTGTVKTDGEGEAVVDPETGKPEVEDDGC